MPNRRAFVAAVLAASLSACSSPTPDRDQALSMTRSAISFTAESELFIDAIRQQRTTRRYAEGHLEYLADAVRQSALDLDRAVPTPDAVRAAGECRVQVALLLRELAGIRAALGDDTALAAARNRLGKIRTSLQHTASAL